MVFDRISPRETMKTCQANLSSLIILIGLLKSRPSSAFVTFRAPTTATGREQSTRLDVASVEPYTTSSTSTSPQANPNADASKSLSGVSRESVLQGLELLFPPNDLQMRNAASRTDGYWAYISKGEEPPMDLTYGEFDFHFFAQLLDRAHHHYYAGDAFAPSSWTGDSIFCDIGSGTGRLALGAAALYPDWKECRGVELLQGIHNVAVDKLNECTNQMLPSESSNNALPMAPVTLSCGSFEDPTMGLGDVNVAFAFSSCFTPELMEKLGQAIGRQCKPRTIVITTDYMLPLENYVPPIEGDSRSGSYRLELAEKIDGWCWLTGGCSTAYIHRVVDSLASTTY